MGFGPAQGRYTFAVDGQRYQLLVPEDGRDLLAAAAEGDWRFLVPGLVDGDGFHDRLDDPDDYLDMNACMWIVWEIAEDVFGVPWWTACRLAKTAAVNWDIYGAYCVSVGHDPLRAAPAAWHVSATLAWLRAGASDEKKAAKLERDLFKVPTAVVKSRRPIPRRARDEASAADFARHMNKLKGGG